MSSLTGKVAVVTGASKGIGAAIAQALAAAGAAVAVNYASDSGGAERVVAAITEAGGKAIAVRGDVSKREEVRGLFAETRQRFGALDVLVNNAGVYRFTTLEEVTEQEFHRQFDINVLGLLLATQRDLGGGGPAGGRGTNTAAVASRSTPPGSAIYTATKGAVTAITQVLAKELAPRKIRVNSINPGAVETEGTHTMGMIGGDFEKQIVAQTPLGRLGQPGDIAPIALFLASPDSGWITGEELLASGGTR